MIIYSSLLSAGVFVLTAQGFLVVPEANSLPEVEDKAPTTLDTAPQHISINLDCSTCPYALNSLRDGRHEWTADVASDLELNFASEDNSLKLNDIPFYPIQNPTLPPRLTVSQKKKDGEASTMEGFDGKLGLSYSVEFSEKKFDEHNLLQVVMTILGLDGEMVKIDNVEITAIKDADGKLTLHSISSVPASPDAPDARCESILCRVFTKLMVGVNKAKASAKGAAHKMKCVCMKCFHKLTGHKHHHKGQHHKGHKGGMAVPHRRPDGIMELPSHIQFQPMNHNGHSHHRHHRGFLTNMAMVLRTTVRVVFVPILIGVAFGMAASAIGMLVGQAVIFLWTKFRRAPATGAYVRLETDEKEAPPPAYKDVESVEVVDEKEAEAKA